MNRGPIRVFNSQNEEYFEAFQFFLKHTDEKEKSVAWLKEIVEKLPSRYLFVDAGAGEGGTTAELTPYFKQTIALEPNPKLQTKLKQTCPHIEIRPAMILEANIPPSASFVLCSHVFYYILPEVWLTTLNKLVSWLSADGVLVLMLQHHASDCLQMHSHFCDRDFNLTTLVHKFQNESREHYEVTCKIMPLDIVTPDLPSAYKIAEFMLNLLPLNHPPIRAEVEAYIHQHFYVDKQGYRFSSDQLLIQIYRK